MQQISALFLWTGERVTGKISLKSCFCLASFLLNACKLHWKGNLSDFYVESIAFRINILINATSSYESTAAANMIIGTYLDQTQAIM